MDVYVLGGKKKDALLKLCDSISTVKGLTKEHCLKSGFTNCYAPSLFFSQRIKCSDNYPIEFSLSIDASTMQIDEVNILDMNFGQPYFCDDNEFGQIKTFIDSLVKKNVLKFKE